MLGHIPTSGRYQIMTEAELPCQAGELLIDRTMSCSKVGKIIKPHIVGVQMMPKAITWIRAPTIVN